MGEGIGGGGRLPNNKQRGIVRNPSKVSESCSQGLAWNCFYSLEAQILKWQVHNFSSHNFFRLNTPRGIVWYCIPADGPQTLVDFLRIWIRANLEEIGCEFFFLDGLYQRTQNTSFPVRICTLYVVLLHSLTLVSSCLWQPKAKNSW